MVGLGYHSMAAVVDEYSSMVLPTKCKFMIIREGKNIPTDSSSPASLEKSTRSLRFMISKSLRLRTADAAESNIYELFDRWKPVCAHSHTVIWIFCKSETLWSSCFAIVYKTE